MSETTPIKTPIELAIEKLGKKSDMARALGVTPAYVTKMVRTGWVPAEQCRKIEQLTGVSAELLNPKFFGKPNAA